MVMSSGDIQKGMDVYGSDGEKVGTVAELFDTPQGSTASGDSSDSGGGQGALGDESRLDTSYGHGGQGSLGDETRLRSQPGHGGSQSLGDESTVGGPAHPIGGRAGDNTDSMPVTDADTSDMDNGTPPPFQGNPMPTIQETDVLVVEEVPSSTVSGYDTTDTGVGATSGTPGGYAGSGAGYESGYGTGTGTMTGATTGTGYFKVDHGGLLGIGTQHLYVPFSAVQNVVPGERVDLNVTKDQAGTMFNQQPGSSDNNT